MRAGDLRHKIIIQQVTETKDAYGAVAETWTTFVNAWASIEPLRGQEFFAARQVNADVTHRVRTRYRAGVTPKMRIAFGDRVLEIEVVLNLGERNRELELLCSETV